MTTTRRAAGAKTAKKAATSRQPAALKAASVPRPQAAAPKPARQPAPAAAPPARRTAAATGRTRSAIHERAPREVDENGPTPPSSLDLDRTPSAARSGRREMRETRLEHNESSPVLTGGDPDANWQDAYHVGDEAPGGDNPTPDQDRVDDIGRALGVEYQPNEELKASDKITERDRHRWELDPASAEDYRERE